MRNPIMYVVINGDLEMSAGKAAAQAVHASMMLEGEYEGRFANSVRRSVIVLLADDAEQIRCLHEYLMNAGLFSAYYIDEGVNEVGNFSLTALAVEPFESDDEEKRQIFEGMGLFDIFTNKREITKEYLEHAAGYRQQIPRFVQKTINWLKFR